MNELLKSLVGADHAPSSVASTEKIDGDFNQTSEKYWQLESSRQIVADFKQRAQTMLQVRRCVRLIGRHSSGSSHPRTD